jgi:hypothetical protein
LEHLTTRKRSPENVQDVMPKDPINVINVKNIVAKAENVFSNV